MKKVLITSAIVGSMLFMPFAVLADDASSQATAAVAIPEAPVTDTVAAERENVPASIDKEDRVSFLSATALRLTGQRIASLTQLKNKLQRQKNLTDAQKSALIAELDAQIAAMNKIRDEVKAGGKDAVALRALIKSIYSDYRIYAVFIPKIHLETALYAESNHAAKFDELFAKFQTRIDAAKQIGVDVSAWQKKLDDAKALKAQVVQKIADTTSTVSALKAEDYPDKSKQVITDARKAIKDIEKTFRSINTLLKELNKMLAGAKQTAIQTARTVYTDAVKTANSAYKTAVKSAQSLTDKQARKDALKTARDAMQNTKKSALSKMKETINGLKEKK